MAALTIIVVEDDPTACNAFVQVAKQYKELRIAAITEDADQALKDIKDYLPEVIILDLELHKGGGSGLDVMKGVRKLGLSVDPYIVVTTNNISPVTYDYARELGAGYIFYKHQKGYSEQGVLEFLLPMKEMIQRRYGHPEQPEMTIETPAQLRSRIIRRIHAELDHVGINVTAKGYDYLTDAILLTMERPRQHLCLDLARQHRVTESSVERAMQNAINRAWQITDIDNLLTYYTARIGSDRGVPTMTEFVYYYARKLRDEYGVGS